MLPDEQAKSKKYWFGFRQTIPRPPGKWVICGPYSSHEEAMKERERSKAWDAEVTLVFIADNEKEAQERIKFFQGG